MSAFTTLIFFLTWQSTFLASYHFSFSQIFFWHSQNNCYLVCFAIFQFTFWLSSYVKSPSYHHEINLHLLRTRLKFSNLFRDSLKASYFVALFWKMIQISLLIILSFLFNFLPVRIGLSNITISCSSIAMITSFQSIASSMYIRL